MDPNNTQPTLPTEPTVPSPVQPIQTPITVSQQEKPKLEISDSEAKALLTLKSAQIVQPMKTSKPPMRILLIVSTLLGLVVLASYLVGSFKPSASPQVLAHRQVLVTAFPIK
jgi:hypothetical protein